MRQSLIENTHVYAVWAKNFHRGGKESGYDLHRSAGLNWSDRLAHRCRVRFWASTSLSETPLLLLEAGNNFNLKEKALRYTWLPRRGTKLLYSIIAEGDLLRYKSHRDEDFEIILRTLLIESIFRSFQMPRCQLRANCVTYGAVTVKLSIKSVTKLMLVSSSSPDAGLVEFPVVLSTACTGDSSPSILATQSEANS